MAGLPKKFAKMGFKKGWKLFKQSHGTAKKRKSRASVSAAPARRRKRRSTSTEISGVNFPQIVKRARRRISSSKTDKIIAGVGDIALDLSLLVAGMAGSAQIKKMSPVKNMFLMNLLMFGGGAIGAVMAKKRMIRIPCMGIAASALISQVKTSFPKIPISGDEDFVYLPQGEDMDQIEYQGEEIRGGDMRGEIVDGDYVQGDYVQGDESEYGADDYVYGEAEEM